jgi:hypothetical protein
MKKLRNIVELISHVFVIIVHHRYIFNERTYGKVCGIDVEPLFISADEKCG